MGRSELGWLDSHFHFSFAEYHNPENIHFGVLRVVNDDIIQPETGFDTHPHKDMEILTYVIDGELTHADSMSNKRTLTRGQVQYMSAGTGVLHSEHNLNPTDPLRLLQIWIFPDKRDYTPNYGDYAFEISDRQDKWLPIATSVNNSTSTAPIQIHADINMYATLLTKGSKSNFSTSKNRQTYLILIEGKATIDSHTLTPRDALEIVEQDITIEAQEDNTHILLIEMAKF